MDNKEMAAVLFNIATVLRGQGNENPFRTAAYERGARALMGLGREASQILQTEEKVPFRRPQRIGKKLQAKIREMATTANLEQYTQLVNALPLPIGGLMGVPGIGPKTADRIHQALGIGSAADLVHAARDGRLRSVRGFGPKRTKAIAVLPLPQRALANQAERAQTVLFDLSQTA